MKYEYGKLSRIFSKRILIVSIASLIYFNFVINLCRIFRISHWLPGESINHISKSRLIPSLTSSPLTGYTYNRMFNILFLKVAIFSVGIIRIMHTFVVLSIAIAYKTEAISNLLARTADLKADSASIEGKRLLLYSNM